jgi:hypothetical protein
LSTRGRSVAAAYRESIGDAGGGRHGAFADASTSWATRFELMPDDGIYLSEIANGSLTVSQLGEALAICSQSQADVKRCLERLLGAGLVVATT